MRVILTHEQADFDALASLLAGYMLDEAAFPVLPKRMNRNVRAFITLYGADLPFIEQRDLPTNEISSVLLVDTQGLITIKGISPSTQIQVIDHHPLREDLQQNWIVEIDQTGATATILVEALRELNKKIDPIQATLLLLGIYEDTGSLTYSRTISRDLQAAAFLLDRGASLRIASDFLNHPLSADQLNLYEALRASIENLRIQGHSIVLASANAGDMDEELSTLAHKLRDLLDPDALFLVITTRSGVQIIARSTSDQIDVGMIMSEFGGGGHDRAAAALIRDQSNEMVQAELKQKLNRLVRPAVTVAEIMSYGLRYLKPDVYASEAAELMQRYGYEGYPIVNDGRVVGLLTRRAVDRALAHKLNLKAASLMDAGNISISPTESVENLQRMMTESGWGQIPVVDGLNGEIMGIVTRTDLIKTFSDSLDRSGSRNLANRLETALPPARLALLKLVAETGSELNFPIYVVGGFVRDLLLERPSLDFDFVVEGDAVTLARELCSRFGGRVTTHQQFGTAKWHLVENKVKGSFLRLPEAIATDLPVFLDLITARTEFYTHPTALPEVERGSIKLDLHRRDFTINTLALRLDGQHYGDLHDYWGGLNDLRQGFVRVLHSLSFVDDPTRMLRAVRFEQRFDFTIEERSLHLLEEARPLIAKVTGDRIRHELDHIIDEPLANAMFDRLSGLGLLTEINPGLTWDLWLEERTAGIVLDRPVPEWANSLYNNLVNFEWIKFRRDLFYNIWLLRVPEAKTKIISRQLRFPKHLKNQVQTACQVWQFLPELHGKKPSGITARLSDVPLTVLISCYLAVDDVDLKACIMNYLLEWQYVTPRITGNEIRKRGLPPSPIYRDILSNLRTAWLDGVIKTEKEEQVLFEELLLQVKRKQENA